MHDQRLSQEGPWRRRLVGGCTAVFILLVVCAGLLTRQPSQALPEYARRYDVTCQTCHTIAPALNAFGQAFQANNFNWPGRAPEGKRGWMQSEPLSGLVTTSRFEADHQRDANFRTLELYLSDGFHTGPGRAGGYFVDAVAAVRQGQGGDLGPAFVALPVAGRHGQYTLTAGQFTPMMYQYDQINSLTQSLPAALIGGVDGFAFASPVPGARLDYFDNRGRGTADGNYLSLGVPFEGHLSLNQASRLYGSRGMFVQAFHRQGTGSFGVFGYERSGNNLEGMIGTLGIGDRLTLLGVGSLGHDTTGTARALSLQGDYLVTPWIAVTGRMEALSGLQNAVYPVAALTVYPFHQSVIRLTGETIQAKGNRSDTIYLFAQF